MTRIIPPVVQYGGRVVPYPTDAIPQVNLSARLGVLLVTAPIDPTTGYDFIDGGVGNDSIVALNGVDWTAQGFEVGKNLVVMNPTNALNAGSFPILAISTTTTTNDTIEVATATLTADTADQAVDFVQVDYDASGAVRELRSDPTGTTFAVTDDAFNNGWREGGVLDLGLIPEVVPGFAYDGNWMVTVYGEVVTDPPDSVYYWTVLAMANQAALASANGVSTGLARPATANNAWTQSAASGSVSADPLTDAIRGTLQTTDDGLATSRATGEDSVVGSTFASTGVFTEGHLLLCAGCASVGATGTHSSKVLWTAAAVRRAPF